ncbi:HAD-like protein [Fistulina hepatica ATCC 64428]|uniref:HAD-like protein n=1 Tax=Fistulina hepatica ATCC 64428 TaxID=1128425 RepID=A0A0D7AEC7_9AGAR|nr:HAD-like protein [Fistulina hepatica ATCC 64428]
MDATTTPITVQMNAKVVLFDMDGTLIDSSPAVTAAWQLLKATGYDFLDLPHILASAHGYRTIDALRKWCMIDDEVLLRKEVVRFEEAILSNASNTDGGGIIALPGVKDLLHAIQADRPDENQGWTTHFYASRALPAAGLKTPLNFVTAESVNQGKPAPDPYLLGARLSGVDPRQCIVVEDAPTGIRSGKAAGCLVLATCTSHTRAALEKENPDFLVGDLSHVTASRTPDGGVSLFITQPTGRAYPESAAPTPVDTPLSTPPMSRTVSGGDLAWQTKFDVERGETWLDDDGALSGVRAQGAF